MRRGSVAVAVVWRLVGLLLIAHAAVGCTSTARRPRNDARVLTMQRPGWPRPQVLDVALRAWHCGRESGAFGSPLLTVIDYSLPSTERRLWVIDVPTQRVLNYELVAHGEGSGENYAVAFSNEPGSRQTSLGLFRTEDTYLGGNGYSLRLNGLEPGLNDRAMERKIVVHGAAYVDPDAIVEHGRLGRSWGCPALQPAVSRTVIDRIKGGSALFAYYPDNGWVQGARYLRCDAMRLARR